MTDHVIAGPAPVEVYLLAFGDHLTDPATGVRGSQGSRLRSIVELAVAAEAAGFTGVAIGEHHFSDYLVSAPELLLAAIAARTDRLRLCTAVTLLGLDDPVRVAERLCLLDQLSGGRAEMVVARGVPSTATWAAFGCDGEAAVRARTADHLGLLLRLLTEENVSWTPATGSRSELAGVTVQPRPAQRPHPLVWMGGGLSTISADLAVQHRLPLMLPSTFRPPMEHLELVRRYRRQMTAAPPRVGLPVHVWVHQDRQQAWPQWRPYLQNYLSFSAVLRGAGSTPDAESLLDGPAVCGDPSYVAQLLNDHLRAVGADRLLVAMDVGAVPAELVTDAISLFGREVLPLLTNPAEARRSEDRCTPVW